MEKQKNTLVEAMCRLGAASCRAYIIQSKNDCGDEKIDVNLQSIDDLWLNVLKFTEANDYKVTTITYPSFVNFKAFINWFSFADIRVLRNMACSCSQTLCSCFEVCT